MTKQVEVISTRLKKSRTRRQGDYDSIVATILERILLELVKMINDNHNNILQIIKGK